MTKIFRAKHNHDYIKNGVESDEVRITRRIEKLRNLKIELIKMLDGDNPDYVQRQILTAIDDRIKGEQTEIKRLDE